MQQSMMLPTATLLNIILNGQLKDLIFFEININKTLQKKVAFLLRTINKLNFSTAWGWGVLDFSKSKINLHCVYLPLLDSLSLMSMSSRN